MTFASRKTSSQIRAEQEAYEIDCPSCGKPPGQMCISSGGRTVWTPHKRRMDARNAAKKASTP
jgi:hypothetical protein